MNADLLVEVLVVSPMASNCYILHDAESRKAVVVDPGGDGDEILKIVREKQLSVEAILLTHGHIDHIGAVSEVVEATGAPVAIHPADAPMLTSAHLCGATWCGVSFQPTQHQLELLPDKPVPGPFPFRVLHTPGHSPGCVVLWWSEKGLAIVGDLIFEESIGRTDLPGGDDASMDESLRHLNHTLPGNTTLLPGHGRPTTLERERRSNPYLKLALKTQKT